MTNTKIVKSGKLYKVTSPHTEKVYIGSTGKGLGFRFSRHKGMYSSFQNNKAKHYSVYEVLKYGDADIYLIEKFKNITKEELKQKEGEAIMNEENCVNKNVAGRHRTMQQYYLENKEELLAKMKLYVEKNKEAVFAKRKEWREKQKLIKKAI